MAFAYQFKTYPVYTVERASTVHILKPVAHFAGVLLGRSNCPWARFWSAEAALSSFPPLITGWSFSC